MLNLVKVGAIRITDWLNRVNDPFPEFDRPALPKYPETLFAKAAHFETQMLESFAICGGTIFQYTLPIAPATRLDLGDQALWHGVYTFMWACSYAATHETWRGDIVSKCLVGLRNHQLGGKLIRGIDDGGRELFDASNDQATGHLLGLYGVWRWGTQQQRRGAAELLDSWASDVLKSGHALTNPDCRVTTYGQLVAGWKTDPLRLTLCMAIYALAYSATSANEYRAAYTELYHTYGELAPFPKVKLWWIDTHYDTHRAAIHLMILEDTYGHFESAYWGARRLRDMVRKEGNIWVNALCARIQGPMADDHELAVKVLSEFTIEDKRTNEGRDNYAVIDQARREGRDVTVWPQGQVWSPKAILWNGTWMADEPLPRWTARAQDFFWQRNLRSLDVGSDGEPADTLYNGGDYLAAYWLMRLNGVIGADE